MIGDGKGGQAVEEDLNDDERKFSSSGVQLGLIQSKPNLLFKSTLWKNWDGGKVGGHPVWLDVNNHPTETELTCHMCRRSLTFLLQLYCPLDEPKSAFHRCLYLFICRKRSCVLKGSIKCFRSQLAQCNPYYSFDPEESVAETRSTVSNNKCAMCSSPAPFACSRCKSVYYCDKVHQKSHWTVHKHSCKPNLSDAANYCFKEYGLEVSEEILAESSTIEVDAASDEIAAKVPKEAWENTDESDEPDEDADLTQNDFNDAAGIERVDELYEKFLSRIRRGNPSQVIRYNRWPSEEDINCSAGPLPISSDSIVSKCSYRLSTEPSTEAPVFYRRDDPKHYAACMICRVCGSELQFEFQVMPQILYYLGVDRQTDVIRPHESQSVDARDHISASLPEELFHNPTEEDIDFGTLDVYTCPNSCSCETGVAEECVFVVPPANAPKEKVTSEGIKPVLD